MSKTIMITLPDILQERNEVLRYLSEKGLITDDSRSIETPAPGKWAQVAHELAKDDALGGGIGDEFRAGMREFRESFFRSNAGEVKV